MLKNFFVFTTTAVSVERIPDCSSAAGKNEAAILHTITDIKHDKYIEFHYNGQGPKLNTFSHGDIFDVITRPLPGGGSVNHLEFIWDSVADTITFVGRPLPYNPASIEYSVCLFEGIDILDSVPDSYVFVKAVDKDGKDTIVFKTLKGGNVKHFYDLSHDKP